MDTTTSIAPLSVRERWLAAALLGGGLVTFAIDASNTNLILPQLMTNLRVELSQIHWVFTAAGIARTMFIPALSWLSGWWGPRTLYLACLGSLVLGALGSVLAWDWPSLVCFRILAGAGGGMIPPLSMAMFYQIFPPRQRGMALGLSLLGWSVGPAFGPLAGGYLLEFASWRAVYAMTLPLGGICWLAAWWLLAPLRRPARRRLDLYGLLTMSIAVTTLLLALSQGNREGWDSEYILTLFTIAGLATVAFIAVELSHPEPLVELRLFHSVPFVMATLVLVFTTIAFRSTGPMVPVLMQRLLNFDALHIAWTQVMPNLLYGVAVLLVGRLSDRLHASVLVLTGLALYAAIFIGYAGLNEVTTASMMVTFLIFRFVAEAFIVSPNNLSALQALPEEHVLMASGLLGLLRSVANTLGPALAVVIWDRQYGYYLQCYADNTAFDISEFAATLDSLQAALQHAGEIVSQIPAQALALLHDRLLAEASTAAWKSYFLFNVMLAMLSLLPALPIWQRLRPASLATPAPEVTSGVPTTSRPS